MLRSIILFASASLLIFGIACAPSPSVDSAAPAAETPPDSETPDAGQGEPDPAVEAGEATQIFDNAAAAIAAPTAFDVFVFYLHGRIIEDAGRRPTHPDYGVYEYDEVLRALAVPGVAVISEARGPETDVTSYASTIVSQIVELFAAGVEPAAISVIGFSKGGSIALQVSHLLGHDDVGFIILAACGSWLDGLEIEGSPLRLYGRMLSIHEESDRIGSCRPWVEPSLPNLFFHEIEIAIGGSHGAFYAPRSEWLDQTLVWTGAPSVRQQLSQPERIDVEANADGEG